MIDQIFAVALSNTCLAIMLATFACLAGRKLASPSIAHALWMLVLVKLLTPPLVSVPVPFMPGHSDTPRAESVDNDAAPAQPSANGHEPIARLIASNDLLSEGSEHLFHEATTTENVTPRTASSYWLGEFSLLQRVRDALTWGQPWLFGVWLVGGCYVLTRSLVRVRRFGKLLREHARPAPTEVHAVADDLAHQLGLGSTPRVVITSAQISPMVWWAGQELLVVLPTAVLMEMPAKEWRWVLAHEFAHIKRRDHVVRWIEWLCCVCFWWNPVMWVARRNLRATEEICCDSLVISTFQTSPQSYATAILKAVESVVQPVLRPPAMASEINSGGFLERRFKMILSGTPVRFANGMLHRWTFAAALLVLPFGVIGAQDFDSVSNRLREAVENGELTKDQANMMLGTLKKSLAKKKEPEAKRPQEPIDQILAEIKAAVRAEKLSKEDALAKIQALKAEHAAELERSKAAAAEEKAIAERLAIAAKIKAAVQEGAITEEEGMRKWRAINEPNVTSIEDRPRNSWRDKQMADESHEILESLVAPLQEAVAAGDIERATDLSHAIQDRMRAILERESMERRYVERVTESMDRHVAALHEVGIMDDRMEPSMDIARRLADQMRAEGRVVEIHGDIERLLRGELKLNPEQVAMVHQVARELAEVVAVRSERRDAAQWKEALHAEMVRELTQAGVPKPSIRPAIGVIQRLAPAIREAGDRFEVPEDTKEYLRDLGMTWDQINVTIALAERLAAQRNPDKERELLFGETLREIERAVEGGELSKEDAKRKIDAIRQEIFDQPVAAADMSAKKRKYEAIVRELKLAVEQNKLSAREAEAKINAMQREWFETKKKPSLTEAGRRQVMAKIAEIQRSLESGQISAEEGQEKLRVLKSYLEDQRK